MASARQPWRETSRTTPSSTATPSCSPPPASQTLLIRAAERGDNLGAITALLIRLLDQYGASELEAAIRDALDRDVPHPNAVRLALERRRHHRQQAPPIAPPLPAHLRARDTVVKPHPLETYDQLTRAPHDDP